GTSSARASTPRTGPAQAIFRVTRLGRRGPTPVIRSLRLPQTYKPPATHRVYDVCVVGSQLGGAVAGALLARRGYRVRHVDHDGLGSGYDDGGYFLPYAPALIPAPRFLPAADAALSGLGLSNAVARPLEPCLPDPQLLLP